MQPPHRIASQFPSVLGAAVGTGLLAVWGAAASREVVWLPEYVGPQALGLVATLYAIAGFFVFVVSLLLPVPRFAFCAASVTVAFLLHTVAFLAFGTLLATEDELAGREQMFWFLGICLALCGLAAWSVSVLVAKFLSGRNRVA